MKRASMLGAVLLLAGAASSAQAERHSQPLIVTASNDPTANELLVYDNTGRLQQRLATQGQGGVSGNAGGIAVHDDSIAVVNFGSASVTLFERERTQSRSPRTAIRRHSSISRLRATGSRRRRPVRAAARSRSRRPREEPPMLRIMGPFSGPRARMEAREADEQHD